MKNNLKDNGIINLMYKLADAVICIICIIISLISHSVTVNVLALSINVILLLKIFLRMKGANIQ